MEILLLIFLTVAVLLIAAVLFCGWLVVSCGRFCLALLWPKRKRAVSADAQCCTNAHCECENPQNARFCRRCGKSLPSLMRIVASRAALL